MLRLVRSPAVARVGVRALRAPLPAPLPARTLATKPRQGVVSYAAKLMSDPVIEVIALASRIARILLGSALAVGTVTFVAWEGAHQYVEHVAMWRDGKPGAVTENDPYAWQLDDVLQHVGHMEGTDARLGIFGRHIVRSAWIAENWGGGIAPAAIFGQAPRGLRTTGVQDLSAHQGLTLAERFLNTALLVAEQRKITVQEFAHDVQPLDTTAVSLEAWLANLRAKIGTPAMLAQAGLAYEKLYDAYAAQPNAGAYCALLATRLGALQGRLGHTQYALEWFDRALHGKGSTLALVDGTLGGRAPRETPAEARNALGVLRALSRVYVQEATSSASPRASLYDALRAQVAGLRLAEAERARGGAGVDAALQHAWALEVEGELAVHIAETLYALERHPAQKTWWRFWGASDKLLATRPTGAPSVPAGRYEPSRAWLAFAAERAAAALAQLAAETPTENSQRHAAQRIGNAATQVDDEAQQLMHALSTRT